MFGISYIIIVFLLLFSTSLLGSKNSIYIIIIMRLNTASVGGAGAPVSIMYPILVQVYLLLCIDTS